MDRPGARFRIQHERLPILETIDLVKAINKSTPHLHAWPDTYTSVANRPLAPFVSVRGSLALIVEPESGFWEVVPVTEVNSRTSSIAERVANAQIRPPDPTTYDSDFYPLECVLYLTNKCNFSCTYCYYTPSREADWRHFDSNLLEKAVRMVFNEPKRNSLCFLLFGGESLAAFELLQRVVDYINIINRAYNKHVTFRMQTNGSLVTPEIAAYLKASSIGVGISLDGPPDVHDHQRKQANGRSTHADVLKGMNYLTQANVPFSITSTVGAPDMIEKVMNYFITEKFTTRIKISPMLPEGAGRLRDFGSVENYAKAWGQANVQAARRLIEHNKRSSFRIVDGNLSAMVTHLTKEYRPDICLRTPCGAASGMIEFHPDGTLITCDKTLYSTELGVIANIRDLSEGTSLLSVIAASPLVQAIKSRTVDTIPKCSHCAVKRHCGGSCTLASYGFFKSFFREDVMCGYRRYVFEELMWMMADDPSVASILTNPDSITQ